MSECCPEPRCRRSQPIRLTRIGESWYAVTRWRERDEEIEVIDKHLLDPMLSAALEYAWRNKDEVMALYEERQRNRLRLVSG